MQYNYRRGFQLMVLRQVLPYIQVTMGIITVIFGGAETVMLSTANYSNGGLFIWVGLAYIIVAILAMTAAYKDTKGWTVTSMVMNILSAAITCPVYMNGVAIELILATDNGDCQEWKTSLSCNRKSTKDTFVALDSIQVIMALAQFIVAIVTAVLCCKVVCRCCQQSNVLLLQNPLATDEMHAPQQDYPMGPSHQYGVFDAQQGA